MAAISFNAATVAPSSSFDPIPAGWYNVQATDSSISPTKNQTGMILKITWDVLDGPFKGRKVFDRINVQNANPTAEKIGQEQLSAICHATGVIQLQDTLQLHSKPISIKVSVRKSDGQFDDSNEVKGYKALTAGAAPAAGGFGFGAGQASFAGQVAQPAAAAAPAAAAPAAGQAATPPWQKAAA